MPKDKLVTIMMPVHNALPYLKRTIDTVLNQSYKNFEIVICDDGSTDGSYEYLKNLNDRRIIVERNDENRGIAFARNRILDIAKGQYIAIWDADDLGPENRIEVEVEAIETTGADVVIGHYQVIDEFDNKKGEIHYTRNNPKYIRACLMLGNIIPNGTALIDRHFLERNSLRYEEDKIGLEDYLFWVRCADKHACFYTVDDVMLYYRTHEYSITMRTTKQLYDQRKKQIRKIQRIAISSAGIDLSEKEYEIIYRYFGEYPEALSSIEDIKKLYQVLQKINRQAWELDLDNKKEVSDLCRNKFAERINQARFMWE